MYVTLTHKIILNDKNDFRSPVPCAVITIWITNYSTLILCASYVIFNNFLVINKAILSGGAAMEISNRLREFMGR